MIDQKIIENFPGLIVRKDLTKTLKGNAIVPSYVLEYLLGQYCATDDVESIESGIETVKGILAKHYVNRNEAGLIKSTIKEKGRHKVIDKVSVDLNEKSGVYEASFSNLGIKKVQTDSDYIKQHPKLLVGGVWSIVDVEYELVDDPKASPWTIDSLKPIQVSHADLDEFKAARTNFTTEEWIDALIQSIGFNPEMLGRRQKLLQLVRLVPFCERNFNYIELGPKGTGKSHIFSEFSPHGMIVSGGEVTAAKLFVNNSGKTTIGLVGFWDSVAFDEFAGKDKRVDKNLVDIMKNYMANKSFSRGVDMMSAEASMSFLGNTRKSVAYMLKHSHFFDDLPDKYIDAAFLDRIHFYNPGWESSIIRSELFTDGFGFIVDYLAEILKKLRNFDESHAYSKYFKLDNEISTRDRDGIHKTFSGLMKIIYPHGECTKEEAAEILSFAVEGRKRVKDHLMRIDSTFNPVEFCYHDLEGGTKIEVKTLEEIRHPNLIGQSKEPEEGKESEAPKEETLAAAPSKAETPQPELESGKHVTIPENATGISFEGLFADYLKGATEITVHDPYIRLFWQLKNMMEFLEMVHQLVPEGDQVEVKLVTKSDMEKCVEQDEALQKMEETFTGSKVTFSYEYDNANAFHARSISTDTGWKITLDRGLDIFQRHDMSPFSLAGKVQEERQCKAFEVTYLKNGG
ncbi:MAG TPA: BREX system Lon protease-like protein BrxL [Opitutae bacterium]|nr:TIGR02688 family protein [Puniceicoccaceae bacterium]HBR92739.1 BREX system Lon protease-like protein BrxL [Opitutae bacterium]|tara:strand:- start:108 stop:2159 length:2052 start_codon:yes stop_codon:yes gene_type:complete